MGRTVNEHSYMGTMEIPDGKDFPNISVHYDFARGEVVIYTHRMPSEVTFVMVDGEGFNHTLGAV